MYSSVPVTDPVQLRWTVVRLTDLLQALEKENADIRKTNMVLQTQRSKDMMALRNLTLQSCTALRKDLADIKVDFQMHIDLLTNRNQKVLKKTFQTFGAIINSMKEESKTINGDAAEATSTVTKLTKELAEQKGYTGMLKKVVSKLRVEVSDLEEIKMTAMATQLSNKQLIEELTAKLGEIGAKEQAASIENKRLREKVAYFERNEAVKELLRQRDIIVDNYNKLVGELKADKESLEQELAGYQEQIGKLTSALYSKAHFSTYVDLKYQNIKMQSKLNDLLKKSDKKALGITTSGAVAVNTTTNNNNNNINNNNSSNSNSNTSNNNHINNIPTSSIPSSYVGNINGIQNHPPSAPSAPLANNSKANTATLRARSLHAKKAEKLPESGPSGADDSYSNTDPNITNICNGGKSSSTSSSNSAAFDQLVNIDILLRALPLRTSEEESSFAYASSQPQQPSRAKTAPAHDNKKTRNTNEMSDSHGDNNDGIPSPSVMKIRNAISDRKPASAAITTTSSSMAAGAGAICNPNRPNTDGGRNAATKQLGTAHLVI